MEFGLKDKVAIVTGGSRGIGRAEVEILSNEGASLIIVANKSVEEAEKVAAQIINRGGKALAVQADVRKSEDVKRVMETTIKTYGRIDILVNNAGMTGPQFNKPLTELPEEYWDFMMESHLRSYFLCIKYAAPHMIRGGWGRIINTSSIHGRVGGRANLGHYGAAKAGVIALTMTAARELGPKGITANVIAPGFIGTDNMLKNMRPETLTKLIEQIPIGRIGTPLEIAKVVAFLASEAASYLNGAVLDANGGRLEYVF